MISAFSTVSQTFHCPELIFPGQLGGRLSHSPCVFYCYPPSIPSHTPSRQIGRRSCVRFHPNRHQIPESVCHLELIALQFAVVRGHKPFDGSTPNWPSQIDDVSLAVDGKTSQCWQQRFNDLAQTKCYLPDGVDSHNPILDTLNSPLRL